MICIQLSGRLGNQMFQYSYARYLKEITGQDIYIDDRYVFKAGPKKDGWENSLIYFNTSFSSFNQNESLFKTKMNLIQKILFYIDVKSQKKYLGNIQKLNKYELSRIKLLEKFNLLFLWQGYYKFNYNPKKNIFLRGNYESKDYFDKIKPILQKEFEPINEIDQCNLDLLSNIQQSNSVCITIRRGDYYTENNIFGSTFQVCSPKYYENAIKKMEVLVKDAKFFVFSDDIQWCKDNLKFPKDTMFESGNDTVDQKLKLMFECKNFIISNSTFSWWAQYLSKNSNKIVISPSKWFNSDFNSALIDYENWVFLDE